MPRCGQASRSANALPLRSRPITSGISSSMAFCSSPWLTFSDGSARYQKPVSINESGASRFNVSGAAMRKVSVSHGSYGAGTLVRQNDCVLSKKEPSWEVKKNSKASDKNVRPTRVTSRQHSPGSLGLIESQLFLRRQRRGRAEGFSGIPGNSSPLRSSFQSCRGTLPAGR